MKKSFLTRITYANGLWMAGLLVLLLSAFGNLFSPMAGPESPAFAKPGTLDYLGLLPGLIQKYAYWAHLLRFLFLFGTALLLQFITSEFRLIRVRSFFPFFLFCVLAATILPLLPLNGDTVACFFFCWSCMRLFGAAESKPANRAVFDASLLLALASLFQCKLLFLLPFFWIVMGVLQVFSFKSFSASLLGMLSVFWTIAGISFLLDNYDFLLAFARSLIFFEPMDFSAFSSAEMAYTSFLGILMVSAVASFWPRQHLDKLRTRNYLNGILLLWTVVLLLWLFSGNDKSLLLLLFGLSSLMVAHFFSLMDTLFSRFLFLMLGGLSVAVYLLS